MRNSRPNITDNIASPCVLVCKLDANGYCVGCLRTQDEIREWMIMSDYEKRKLLAELKWREGNIKCGPL